MEITRPPDEFRPKKDPIPDAEKLEQKRQELLRQLNDTDRELSRLNPTRRSEDMWERQEKRKKSITIPITEEDPEIIKFIYGDPPECSHKWTRTKSDIMRCSKCGVSRKSVFAKNDSSNGVFITGKKTFRRNQPWPLPKAFKNQKDYQDYQTNGKIPPPPPPPPAPEGPPSVLITEGKPSFPKGRIVPESPIVSKITSWLDRKWFESRPNAEP